MVIIRTALTKITKIHFYIHIYIHWMLPFHCWFPTVSIGMERKMKYVIDAFWASMISNTFISAFCVNEYDILLKCPSEGGDEAFFTWWPLIYLGPGSLQCKGSTLSVEESNRRYKDNTVRRPVYLWNGMNISENDGIYTETGHCCMGYFDDVIFVDDTLNPRYVAVIYIYILR